ncbi:XRE family transcriptional regulator [Desulfovibrio oxamicus]|uniref:XRE family transcriptional regulator n=1 Tax=Nitratidesulfovibrio oxamicus TaxID=32016 RepID=A0ABS0IZK2_9BACT|nr:XRE family transcriptional regulator [Nitratidesulfovibrio oxamicus]MBG3875569.1 XRE family transcriptional regulator [Nitratidesulfovibrio oxamicus]
MQSGIAPTLTELSRQEKLRLWMDRTGATFLGLSAGVGINPAVLGRQCKQDTMPARNHRALVAQGVPAELLPIPLDQRPGPKPRARCISSTAPSPPSPVATA